MLTAFISVLIFSFLCYVVAQAGEAYEQRVSYWRGVSNDEVAMRRSYQEQAVAQSRIAAAANDAQAEIMAGAHKTAVRWSLDLQSTLAHGELGLRAATIDKVLAAAKEVEAMKIEAAKPHPATLCAVEGMGLKAPKRRVARRK